MNIVTAFLATNLVIVLLVLLISLVSFLFLWVLLVGVRLRNKRKTADLLDAEDEALLSIIQVTPWTM
ncbi:MAG: hypothetical protein AAF614_44635 [Chloroflexota bacterium]